MTNIAVENHHLVDGKSTISMVILHSYVELPEGISKYILNNLPHGIFRRIQYE